MNSFGTYLYVTSIRTCPKSSEIFRRASCSSSPKERNSKYLLWAKFARNPCTPLISISSSLVASRTVCRKPLRQEALGVNKYRLDRFSWLSSSSGIGTGRYRPPLPVMCSNLCSTSIFSLSGIKPPFLRLRAGSQIAAYAHRCHHEKILPIRATLWWSSMDLLSSQVLYNPGGLFRLLPAIYLPCQEQILSNVLQMSSW